jgi:glutamine transport system substrate-binding protein
MEITMYRRTLIGTVLIGSFAAKITSAEQVPLTVGVDSDNKPFIFRRDGKFVGFSFDLWVEIAQELKLGYKISPMEFSALVPALQTGNIDVAFSSIFITAARKAVVDFSDPYFVDSTGVLVPSGSANKTIGALASKKVVSVTGTAQVKWIKDNFPKADQTQLPNLADAFLALQAGRVDAIFYDYPTLAYYVATEGRGKVELLSERAGDEIPCGFAFPKGSKLVSEVNEALSKLRADGRYDVFYKKWFGNSPQ